MNYLLLTLGHGSSAIFVDNSNEQQEIIGYEQERLSGIKADSQFPIDAINEIERNIGVKAMNGCSICISHWFNDYTECGEQELSDIVCKYITAKDIEKLKSYKPAHIYMTDSNFTHHDAHAFSAYAFYDYNSPLNTYKPVYCIVADGFGTNEEALSIYSRRGNNRPELVYRAYGYPSSLGLFYQYATAYVGMKENQDEYKFLGYEAHIDEYFSEADIKHIEKCVETTVLYFKDHILGEQQNTLPATTCVIDFELLEAGRKFWYTYFKNVLKHFNIDKNSFAARCAIAYFVQQTVERVLVMLIEKFKMDDVCVVGGCFYNVKLNNKILTSIMGDFCAMPLAGDQGAAIGMYENLRLKGDDPFKFGDLCWGKRRMYNAKKLIGNISNATFYKAKNDSTIQNIIVDDVAKRLANGQIVNIVRGNMEFGPRALCNTSTLMLPSTENVANNNKMNNRNEVMPCAPVCTAKNAVYLFDAEELNRVKGSDKYMICTHEYKKSYSKAYGGVMHHKTLEFCKYTGRPQIISPDDTFMTALLNKVEEICDAKCLVNTSFNAHGNPIVFDIMDIIRNFKYQCEHANPENVPYLIVMI